MAATKQPRCLQCGSTDVQTCEWVRWGKDGKPEVTGSESPVEDCWCDVCDGDFGCTWDSESEIGGGDVE